MSKIRYFIPREDYDACVAIDREGNVWHYGYNYDCEKNYRLMWRESGQKASDETCSFIEKHNTLEKYFEEDDWYKKVSILELAMNGVPRLKERE